MPLSSEKTSNRLDSLFSELDIVCSILSILQMKKPAKKSPNSSRTAANSGSSAPKKKSKKWKEEDFSRIAAGVSPKLPYLADQPTPRAIENISALDLAHLTIKLGYMNQPDGPSQAIDFLCNCQLQLEKISGTYNRILVPTYKMYREIAHDDFREITEMTPPQFGEITPDTEIVKHVNLRGLKIGGTTVSNREQWTAWLQSLDEQLQRRYDAFVTDGWPMHDAYEAILRFSIWREATAAKNRSKNSSNLKQGVEKRSAKKK